MPGGVLTSVVMMRPLTPWVWGTMSETDKSADELGRGEPTCRGDSGSGSWAGIWGREARPEIWGRGLSLGLALGVAEEQA